MSCTDEVFGKGNGTSARSARSDNGRQHVLVEAGLDGASQVEHVRAIAWRRLVTRDAWGL